VRAWRIYDHNAVHAQVRGFDPLGGAGGLHRSARWHHKGQPILYASSNASLALLEVFVHETSESFRERTLLHLEFDDDVETVTTQRLVRLLAAAPPDMPEQGTRDFGTAWLQERRSLALVVPSIVMPYEQNVIINPSHPRAGSLNILTSDVMGLDERLLHILGRLEQGRSSPKQPAPDMTGFRDKHGRTRSSALDALLEERD